MLGDKRKHLQDPVDVGTEETTTENGERITYVADCVILDRLDTLSE